MGQPVADGADVAQIESLEVGDERAATVLAAILGAVIAHVRAVVKLVEDAGEQRAVEKVHAEARSLAEK